MCYVCFVEIVEQPRLCGLFVMSLACYSLNSEKYGHAPMVTPKTVVWETAQGVNVVTLNAMHCGTESCPMYAKEL